jgi:hypothetical protein
LGRNYSFSRNWCILSSFGILQNKFIGEENGNS